MKLMNMKEAPLSTEANAEGKDEYPYGLRIYLEEDQLKKLEIKGLPDLGDEIMFVARAKIVNVSDRQPENEHEDSKRSVGLQIVEMNLGGDKSESKPKEEVLFGGNTHEG